MKLNDLLYYCEYLQDVEIVITDESICGKAGMLKIYLCDKVLNGAIAEISAEDATMKVWVNV